MSTAVTELTPCQYLFHEEPAVVFPNRDKAFVSQSLKTVIEVVDHLVTTKPEALFLFGPVALNNQCHLYALMMVQTVYQIKIQQVLSSTLNLTIANLTADYANLVDKRFRYLAFFLGFAFSDSNVLEGVVSKALQSMKAPPPSKDYRTFLKDRRCVHVARKALNRVFEEHIKCTLSFLDAPLYRELEALSKENLQLTPSAASDIPYTLYTYPKFAGVVYLIDASMREKIPLFFKVKVMTTEGRGSFGYCTERVETLPPERPVIVFELIATNNALTFADCERLAEDCPNYPFRHVSSKNRHAEVGSTKAAKSANTECAFCTQKVIDVTPYRQHFMPLLAATSELLLRQGADFVRLRQKPFEARLLDANKYERLSRLFQESAMANQMAALAIGNDAMSISVSHVHVDIASEATKSALFMDAPFDAHLKARGLL